MPEETFETPQQTEPVVESKPTNWPKIILAAVLGFGLLAGAIYAGYYCGTQQVQQIEKPIPVVSQPTPKPTPTTQPVVEDETEDWKTYTHKLYNYTIKYPPSLYLEELESPNGLVELVRFVKEIERGGESLGVSVTVYDNPTNLSAKKWWEENAMQIFSYQLPISESISEEEIINGYDAYFIKSTKEWFAVPFSYLFINKGNRVYGISTNFPEEDNEDYMLYNQILSTFKFLN